MISDLNTFNGDVFLIVEFKNEKGLSYKVKTPAIIIKGNKVSSQPLITKTLAYTFLFLVICILIYKFLK